MNTKILKLCEALGRDLAVLYKGDTFSALWPFTTNEAEFYIGEFFIQELFRTISKLKKRGIKKQEIAKMFERPSKIAQYFTFFHSARILKKNERLALANDLIDFIAYYRKDPFCTKGENVLKANAFDFKILESPLSRGLVEIEQSIVAVLLLYLELIYPTAMRLGHEFHGPYKKSAAHDGYLLIKEFFNLKPSYLRLKTGFPFESIVFIEETKEKPKLDFFNHLIRMPERERVAIILNSKVLIKEEAEALLSEIELAVSKINRELSRFCKKDFLKLLAKGYFYSIKKLKERLGEDVRIPKLMFEKIEKEEFVSDREKIAKEMSQKSLQELEEKVSKSFLKVFEIDT